MKLPRWLIVSMLTASALASLGYGAWWWVTWPERSAANYARWLAEGNHWHIAPRKRSFIDAITGRGTYVWIDSDNQHTVLIVERGYKVVPDGIVALIMGLDRVTTQPSSSIYDVRELIVL